MSISEVKNNPAQYEKDITLHFSDFWRGLEKFWWVGVVLAALFGGIAFLLSDIFYVPMYTATATFTVYTQNATLSGNGSVPEYAFHYDRATADQLSIVFPYVLQSDILCERVCQDLGVDSMPAVIRAVCVAETNMMTISASGQEARMVYDALRSVIENYSYVTEYILGPTKLVTISAPELPTQPDNASFRQKTAVKGCLLGLAVGAVWIVLYAVMRQTVRTKDDIRRELNQTCIGVLPRVSFKRHRQTINTSILLTNPMVGNAFMESVRLLREAVQNRITNTEKVVIVTSTAPGEGKSVVALNLAVVFAKNQGRVLVIDGDLRGSGISRMLGSPAGKTNGLYQIRSHKQLGIDVLTFDAEARRLRKIMRTNTMRRIIDSQRGQYDLILIDTPPCGMISDAVIIAGAADMAVYVVRQDTVMTTRIRAGIHTLLSADIPLVGCVLNGAVTGLGGYGHDYEYGGHPR